MILDKFLKSVEPYGIIELSKAFNDDNFDYRKELLLSKVTLCKEIEDFKSFIDTYNDIQLRYRDNMFSIFGVEMMFELNDSFDDSFEFMEFAHLSLKTIEGSIGIEFLLESCSKNYIYASYAYHKKDQFLISKSYLFATDFADFLDKIYTWISTDVTEEEILRGIELKEDS
jgi:hypothetical protein